MIKLKTFPQQKTLWFEWKYDTYLKKTFAIFISDKGLICRIYKDRCVYVCVVHIYWTYISVYCEDLDAMKSKKQGAHLTSRSVSNIVLQ